MQYFTLEEALALLPWLKDQLIRWEIEVVRQADVQLMLDQMNQQLRTNGHTSHVEELGTLRSELQQATLTQTSILEDIEQRGIILRDPQRGLVDFLGKQDGMDVFWCWLKGEDTIRFWHPIDTGFSGRQSL